MAKAKHKRSSRAPRKRRRAKHKPRPVEIALGGLAHDIRTPLTGILALSQLLHASDLPERERRWAEAIQGAADHLARLTTIVVDAARASKSPSPEICRSASAATRCGCAARWRTSSTTR
jgi:signal transduction histidine kinase